MPENDHRFYQRTANTAPQIMDYAIAGAGCAGLYCAWRLASAYPSKSIYVFEKDDRFGGRLLSLDLLPRQEGRRAELGGMRFTKQQRLIWGAIQELRGNAGDDKHPLSTRKFNFPTQLMYLRGKQLHYKKDWIVPYNLGEGLAATKLSDLAAHSLKRVLAAIVRSAQKGATPNTDLRSILDKLVDTLSYDALTLEEWRYFQEHASIEGIRLRDMGLWNLLQHCLTSNPDEFLFLHDALGYESLVANSNAAQAIPQFLAGFDVPEFDDKTNTGGYWTLRGGMDALPRLLFHRFRSGEDDRLVLKGHTLESVRQVKGKTGETHFELIVKCNPLPDYQQVAYEVTYCARNLILALPKESLARVEFTGFDNKELRTLKLGLSKVRSHPAFKLFLYYKSPWWTQARFGLDLKSRAVTDLPIRQVYYLGEDGQSQDSLIMASYSDDHYVDFWDPVVNDPRKLHEVDRLKAESLSQRLELSVYAAKYAAPQRVIQKATSQIRIIHEMTDKEDRVAEMNPVFGVVKEWESAWHTWNAHTEPWKTAEDLAKPFENSNVFICGEAYSLEQGWVEGALKSAEMVLRLNGVNRPKWISDNNDDYICYGWEVKKNNDNVVS